MKIISRFVREQRRYTKTELKSIFLYDEQGVEQFIKNLKSYNVLKAVKNNAEQKELTDLIDEDIEVADETATNEQYLYVFTYVGVITVGRRIIKIYPKYLLSNSKPLEEMKTILKVLEKYSNSEEQIINLYNGDGENRSFNLLAVILFLLNDYHEYGIYNNSEDIIEVNGEGPILWDKTIDDGFALIRSNRPYYMEMYTSRSVDDDMDYFKRLHECVLTECSNQLRDSQLLELFNMVPVELSEENISDFGDRDYILDRVSAELSIQFNTRRQVLLKTIYTYIAQDRKMVEENSGFSMYGTTSFNMVWEKVCADVFSNKLDTPIGNLAMVSPLADGYNKNTRLIDIIEHPKWIGNDTVKTAKDTLIPDLITISNQNGEDWFIIFDAKYYNLQLEKEKNLRGNPGIGDVTKQYLYQLAYSEFIRKHNISVVKNCFLMPTESDGVQIKGTVKMEMLENFGLENIQIRLLPADEMFSCYLRRKKIDVALLDL